jgi:nucleoside-diphosphate-sugar epimerase
MDTTFKNSNVLITGGAGFIGSNLALRLVELGANVTIIDSLTRDCGGNLFNIHGIRDKVELVISDVRNRAVIEKLIGGKKYLFNLAGQVSHIDSMNDPLADMEINVRGQLCTLEVCRKENPQIKVVFTGTRQVYGKPRYLPVDEMHSLSPSDVNGINKMAAECYHKLYYEVYGIRTCALRLTNTYGPRQLIKHNRQGFIGWFIRQIMQGEQIKIYGDGKQVRDLNYVDDVVDAILLAATKDVADGQIFNLGGTEAISLENLVEQMIRLKGSGSYTLIPFPAERKRIDIGDFYGDFSKITAALGWRPKTSLEQGLKRTLEFYSQNLEHYIS